MFCHSPKGISRSSSGCRECAPSTYGVLSSHLPAYGNQETGRCKGASLLRHVSCITRCVSRTDREEVLASEAGFWATSKIWNLVSLSLSTRAPGDAIINTRNTATATATTASSTTRRGVAFSLPTPKDSDMSQAGDNLCETIGLGVLLESSVRETVPKSISDLCQAIRNSRKQGVGECCGQILDTSTYHLPRAYEVYPLGSLSDNGDWSLVSLGFVLNGDAGSALTYGDKLRLAWVITSSVL